MGDEVVVVAYRAEWPELFSRAKASVAAVLGGHALAIEHIGSTSVPGLSAKPVIDLLVGVRSMHVADACVPLLLAAGWDFPHDVNDHLEGRRFLRLLADGVRTHHVHLVEHGGPLFDEYIRFRDALRARPELAREYEALKRDLAAKFRDERARYTESKTDFVKRVLAMPK